ncbi:MAG: type III pantothenate kinase, partial [Nitrospinota bacterium]
MSRNLLLVLDVGNTNTVLGLYRGEELVFHWRVSTRIERTADELGLLADALLRERGLSREVVGAVAIASVVPPLQGALEAMAREHFGVEPLVVGPGTRTGVPILYDSPREVGADRVVNAVAGYHKYGGPLIVVDFGTAITFDAISAEGAYLGGAIAPGMVISLEALFERAARLPRVELSRPKTVIGKNTVHSVQAGMAVGFRGLVREVVGAMRAELGGRALAVATGGEAQMFADFADLIDRWDPYLTLDGLRLVWESNA